MASISVIMSVYNEPLNWLKESIESILNQTFREFEFIIINDNPQREDIIESLLTYKGQDNRIHIINNKNNYGPAGSKNKGLAIATGKYIAIMDADDISRPERLERQYHFLENHNGIFLVGSSVKIIGQNGTLKEKITKHSSHKQIVKDLFTGRLAFYHPTIMFRNESFMYREKFKVTLDLDLYLTFLSSSKRFSNLKDVLLYYRVSNKSISMTKKRTQIIYKKLALNFFHERQRNNVDSYNKLDFNDERQLIEFLKIDPDKLEAEVLKEKTLCALKAGDYEVAQKAFEDYKRYEVDSFGRMTLLLFITVPFVYSFYRRLRYQLLRF